MEKVRTKRKPSNVIIFIFLSILSILVVSPIVLVLINSFKGRLFISEDIFALPNKESFIQLENYSGGIEKIEFWKAAKYSLFITVFSVLAILLFTSMTAWYITRVKNKFHSFLYFSFAFSTIVPFQMIMYSMAKLANMWHIDNLFGIIIIYLGIGSGMSVFLFSGFVKSIPIELEEAAMMDGCNTLKLFFRIIIPILKPITVTVGILETMWVWNDYLLPLLVIGTEYRTIPIAIQYLKAGYGSIDMGQMMALIVLAIIPIIVFYVSCQKYIIEGAVAGAVKG